jgi:alkylated DNA repair dioxygenase AlkB
MLLSMQRQLALFGRGDPPGFDAAFSRARRTELEGGAWVEEVPGWVRGHEELFDALERGTRWRSERRVMYERKVAVPRLIASLPRDGQGHPLITSMRAALDARYATDFVHVSMALYRDGRDSVAFHGDTTARDLPEALVATVSLGCRRRFLLKPAAGGESIAFALGEGDLLVMGGSCQRTWRHGIPKVATAGPRISIMFRPIWYPG